MDNCTLTYWKPKDVFRRWQSKSELSCIMANNLIKDGLNATEDTENPEEKISMILIKHEVKLLMSADYPYSIDV